MIPFQIIVKRTGAFVETGVLFSKKKWKELTKPIWEAAGKLWFKAILKKHFTLQAKQEYGYQDRTAKYMKKKARMFHHQLPLVFTGDMLRAVSQVEDVRYIPETNSHEQGVHVVLHGTPYMYMRAHSTDPNKAEELREISEKDAKLIADMINTELQKVVDAEKSFPERFNIAQGLHSEPQINS